MNDVHNPINSSMASERVFISPYAPLSSDGPLPPGLTEGAVASAYKHKGLNPKRVLLNLKIKHFTESTTKRLRKAVDRPEARRRREIGAKTMLAFHDALYFWQKNQSQNVYNRLVKPAEFCKGKLTYLNPTIFRHLVQSERKEGRDFWSTAITPNSEEEALALFALAFALLQETEAYEILEPLLLLGPQFQEFFGVTKAAEQIPLREAQENETYDKGEPEKRGSPEVMLAGETSTLKPVSEYTMPPPQEQIIGAWSAALAKSLTWHETARAKRCEVGKSLYFDREAFDEAFAGECNALGELTQVTERIRLEIEKTLERLTSQLNLYHIEMLIEIPTTPYEQTIWLDHEQDNISEILGLLEDLTQKGTHLIQEGLDEELKGQIAKPLSLKATIQILKERIQAVDTKINEIQNWQETLASLKEVLADCASPRESRSLQKLNPDIMLSLLWRVQVDDSLEPLAPLLLRYLVETDFWGKEDAALEVTSEILNRVASSGDTEAYQEIMTYLPMRILQQLLVCGSEVIARHVLLTTFRESIARRQPFFFIDIWPYEQGRWDRMKCAGEHVCKLFNCLHMLYWRTQNMSSLVQTLVSTGPNAKEMEERDRRLAVARQQATEVLASRLETTGNVTGIFYRLRQSAAARFFRPLVSSIREHRIREVQNELAKLERKSRKGELETEVMEIVGDVRNIRAAHLKNLQRYIETTIEAIKDWMKQETNFAVTETIDCEDELEEEILTAKRHLPLGDKVDHPSTLVGSIEWLEQSVGMLIASVRQGEWPEASFAFFGELPSSDTLFTSPEKSEAQITSRIKWPSWLDPTPSSERSWVCHLHGQLDWKDLLQDGIAKIILGRSRSVVDVLESFMSCGEFEAVIEAARFPEFNNATTAPIVARARDLNFRRGDIETWVNDIDQRLLIISGEKLLVDFQLVVQQLQAGVYEVLAVVDKLDIDGAYSKVVELKQALERLEGKIRTADSERRERFNFLKIWLFEAGVSLSEDAKVHEAEGLAKKILDQEASRRVHLIQLQKLDIPGVPEQLRTAVHDFIRAEDRPIIWPDKEGAELAGLYIENLVEVSQDWWVMLRGLDQEDKTYEKIQEIATLLAKLLPIEVNAIAKRQAEQAQMLSLLFEGLRWTASDFYKVLRERQLIGKLEGAEEQRIQFPIGDLWNQATIHMETLMAESTYSTGIGETVENAYLAFGEKRYQNACDLAMSAWAWAKTNKADEVGPLVSIYAWSKFRAHGAVYEMVEIEALGLLLRHHARIRERAKGLELSDLLNWWIEIVQMNNHQKIRGSIEEEVATVLTKLAEMPPGAGARERFGTLMKVGDPSVVAEILWEAVRGLKDETARARSALLLLLFDLGEDGALQHLFGYAGNYHKYLSAFIALAMRTRSDPSAKLHTAISQNLRTLQGLKDRSFRDFTERVARRLQYESARIQLRVQETLEQDKTPENYILIVSVDPDESDPPLSLKIELLEASDFVSIDESPIKEVVAETLLFDRQELEYVVRPKDPRAASNIILRTVGETASGQNFDKTFRFQVQLSSDQSFAFLGIEELLEIYEGYDAKPVSGQAFVGREKELEVLERSVVKSSPGAVVLYGARRLGKTSLLDELRLRHCLTNRKGSQTLFLVIPVDEFSVGDKTKNFLDRFLRHIWVSVLHDPKNLMFRQFLEKRGVNRQELETVGRFGESFEDTSFLMRLREYLRRLRELAPGQITQVILVLDEFDKLLEHYRKGYEAEVEDLTNQLRRAATEEPDLGLILAGSDLMQSIVGQYRNALYGSAIVIHLEGFDQQKERVAIRQIIAPASMKSRRLFDETVIDHIVQTTGGHPLYMRLLACAAAWLNQRQRVSRGTVLEAVGKLLRNEVLTGYLPDMPNLALQPLQVLKLMNEMDEILSKLLLLQLARHTTLERPWAMWASFAYDERLLNLRPNETWTRLRDKLREANLIVVNDQRLWGFRYPILGERLRIDLDIEFDRLQTETTVILGAET